MARQPALKVLQSTPTDPSQAGPDNRLCGKCGGPASQASVDFGLNLDEGGKDVLFIGDLGEKDREFIVKICEKCGFRRSGISFVSPTLCNLPDPSPTSIRCCRAFVLGIIASVRPTAVMAIGEQGLHALTGNCALTIPPHLGREIDIPELPEQIAYATFHPKDQREGKYPFMDAIQKGLRLKADIQKLNSVELEKPHAGTVNYEGEIVGIDTEFDDDQVWTVGTSVHQEYSITDIEEGDTLSGAIAELKVIAAHYCQAEIDSFIRMGECREEWLQGKDILDTFVLANIQNENLQRKYYYGVEDVLTRLYRAPNWKHETEVDDPAKPGTWGLERRKRRCGYDAWATYRIVKHPSMQAILKSASWVVEWVHRMIPTYHRMKYVGVMVDRQVFDRLHDEYQSVELTLGVRLSEHIRNTYEWPEFELTNNNHLSSLLYDEDKLDLPVLKRTKSGAPSTDAEALDNYTSDPFIEELLVWRKANKLMSTWYGKEAKANSIPLYERIQWQDDGYGFLPVNLGVGQTSTLRRQSNAPNMQNWGKETRQIITSRFRDSGSLVWADYEKLEVFVLAAEIRSTKLLDYFINKGGYLGLASDLMESTVAKGDPSYRATKSVVLGANYNSSPFVVANTLYYKAGVRFSDDFPKHRFKSEHYERSRKLLDNYFHMFPEIQVFFQKTKQELLQKGGVHNRFGQFRHLPCPYGENTPGFKHLWNTAINFKIQSVAGFITGIAAVLLEEQFVDNFESYNDFHHWLIWKQKHMDDGVWYNSPFLCNEVHDELMVDTPLLQLEETCDIMKEVMTKSVKEVLKQGDPTFDVHLAVELEHGRYWHRPSTSE